MADGVAAKMREQVFERFGLAGDVADDVEAAFGEGLDYLSF